jgi:hypothetical protein
VVSGGSKHSRRGIIRGTILTGAALGLPAATAGCSLFDKNTGPDRPDALQPVLDEAVALAALLDRSALTVPALSKRLTPLAADHRAHAAALAELIGRPTPSPGASSSASAAPVGGSPASLLKQLRTSMQAAQRNAATACRQAPADRVMLVGSIAACRGSHVEALR